MQNRVASLGERLAEIFGAPDPYIAFKRACSRLLDDTMQRDGPVRLRGILDYLEVPVVYDRAFGGEEAALRVVDGRLKLAISRERMKAAPRRARFTVAHEIGHLILYRALGPVVFDVGDDDDRSSYREVERYCDFAASHLLLPRERLGEAMRANGLSRRGMYRLAAGFDVSMEALLRAVPDLIADGQIIEWRTYRRHDREETTWRVWTCYAPYRRSGPRPWMPRGSTMRHLELEDLLPGLVAGAILMKSPIALVFGARRSHHDLVASVWPGDVKTSDLALEAGGDLAVGSRQPALKPGRLMVVLGKVGSIDPGLFGATIA